MVGLIDECFEKFPVNSRIKVNNNVGTVMYVGEVAGYSGTWLGIEWDDPKRGKHDGIVDGMRYFKTKHPTSGSMIRPGKVDSFESLEDAAKTKYLDNDPNAFDKNLLKETQNFMHASIFEIVGMEKIARKQSKFEELFDISVAESNVNTAGDLSSFHALSTLNLSSTLIWNWQTVGQILGQVPTLAYLNLSENRMQVPTAQEVRELEPLFRNLKKLNLRSCGLDNWEDVKQTAELFPNIEMLGLQDNDISELTPVDCMTIFKNLKELHLHRTKINNFSEILKLGNIKTLTSLFLMENNISEIILPDCDPKGKLKIFPNLEILNLYFNPLKDSVQLFNELDKLASLKTLNKSPEMSSGFEEMFSLAVGLITGLEVLNKVQLTSDQKRGAQIDIWKKFATNWIQCEKNIFERESFCRKVRAYEKLVEKFGSPIDFAIRPTKKASNLITIKIQNKTTDEIWEKRFPKTLSVQSLLGLIIKRFNLAGLEPKLSYVDAKNPKLVVDLDNCSKSLDFYSVQDGDYLVFSENQVNVI